MTFMPQQTKLFTDYVIYPLGYKGVSTSLLVCNPPCIELLDKTTTLEKKKVPI